MKKGGPFRLSPPGRLCVSFGRLISPVRDSANRERAHGLHLFRRGASLSPLGDRERAISPSVQRTARSVFRRRLRIKRDNAIHRAPAPKRATPTKRRAAHGPFDRVERATHRTIARRAKSLRRRPDVKAAICISGCLRFARVQLIGELRTVRVRTVRVRTGSSTATTRVFPVEMRSTERG